MTFKAEMQNIDTFLGTISQGEHGCLFYLDKQQKLNFLLNFLRNGLEKDQLGVYATASEDVAQIEDGMKSAGAVFQKFSDSVSVVMGDDLYTVLQKVLIAKNGYHP
jgi:KaiC/GvpD/RAD55 family RecA-like ATPase